MNDKQPHAERKNFSPPQLKSKIFIEKRSLITELLEKKQFVTVKCLFYSILFGYISNDIVAGLIFGKKVNYGLRLIRVGFIKFDLVILTWFALFSANILVFYLFKLWANIRISLIPKSIAVNLWDCMFLIGFFFYYLGALIVGPICSRTFDTGAVSNCVLLIEQLRILMKTHSFVRFNVPQVKNYKPHSEQELFLPSLKHYLYFSFAPTFVYREKYPRTKQIDKVYVCQCLIEVLSMIWLLSFVVEVFFVRNFESAGIQKFEWHHIFSLIMQNVAAAFVISIAIFYLVLDRWLNGWSEILRFADRRFYEDWWTSTNYSSFLRKWNIVVQDWLFENVYKEFYENIVPNNKTLAKCMVFLVSAVFHEYILIFMLDEFFPLLFFNFFVVGQFLTNYYIKSEHPFFNMGMLFSFALGNSIQCCLYTMELYARKHCPDSSQWSYFKPRILYSDCIFVNNITIKY